MRYTKSKHSVKNELSEKNSLNKNQSDFGRDEDDPFSIRSTSITLFGTIIAIMTILLPSISVLLVRPSSQFNQVIFNHSIKKDGP